MNTQNIDTGILLERISRLASSRGKTMNAVFTESGVGKNFKSNLNTSRPSMGKITMLANYFGVTVDELLADNASPPPGTYHGTAEPTPSSNAIMLNTQNVRMIPLYSTVSAGFGTQAINYVEDYVPLYIESTHEAQETICIKVSGDSMYPKIEDGDIIQVHKQDSVDSGSLAVVLVDGEEALVKKVVYGETWIELHSINPMYKTVRFNGADVLRVRVLGLVRKIIKNA